jgi:DNA primase
LIGNNDLGRLVSIAARLYQTQLGRASSASLMAQGYLGERRVFGPTIDTYGIGYSPRQAGWLVDCFQDVPTSDLVAAGLVVEGKNGLVDPMMGRVVFPQMTPQGVVVGFVGRAIDPDVPEGYKYVATPQTAIFRRSEIVYRIDLAHRSIISEGFAVVVEGPMDAVLMWQIGQLNTVAVGSKRMTDAQAQILARYTKRIDVLFDRGEEKAFDQVKRARGQYFQDIRQRQVPTPYDDPAEWVRSRIDRELTR